MRTIVDAIDLDGATDRMVTVPGHGARSWRDIHVAAKRMATVLNHKGVRRAGLLGETSLDILVAAQAVWLAGAAVTVLPTGRAQRERIIADAQLDVVLTGDDLGGDLGGGDLGAFPDPGDLAILQYTSGSTSAPRAIPVTHGNLAANLCAIESAFEGGQGHPLRFCSWLPLFHDMGLIGFVCLPMARGWELTLQSPRSFAARPWSWFETIAEHRSTITGGPNFAYAIMTRLLRSGLRADLSSLRFVLCGGEPIDADVMAEFTKAAQPCGLDPLAMVPAYGLAEATLAVAIARPGTGVRLDELDGRAFARLGPALNGTHIRIVDAQSGEPLPERRVGLIEVRGVSVTAPGWLQTGDLGYLTAGELVVCGRQKEVLFAAGRNIYPQDVEAVIQPIEGVKRVAAFGVPGDLGGDRLVVAFETRDPGLRRLVGATVRAEVGLSASDVVVLAPGGLPKTSSGKLRRVEARRRYLDGTLR